MASNLTKKLNTAREQVKQAYLNGAVLREIADLHGVSIGTVRNLLKEMGVDLRPRGRRQKAKAAPKAVEEVVITAPKVVAVPGPVSEQYEGGSF